MISSPRLAAALALAVVALVAVSEAVVVAAPLNGAAIHILDVIVGVLIAKFGTVYDYYFGSSRLSDREPPGGPPERP